MISDRTPLIFWLSLASGVLLVLFEIFQWDIIEIITEFLLYPVEIFVVAFFLVTAISSFVHVLSNFGLAQFWAGIPLLVNIIAILIVTSVPFVDMKIDFDFRQRFEQRQEVVRKIKSGEITSNETHRRGLIHLPDEYGKLSKGGNDILLEGDEGDLSIFFFTYRGLLDNFSGFIYKENNEPPNEGDFQCGLIGSKTYQDNWYWMACS